MPETPLLICGPGGVLVQKVMGKHHFSQQIFLGGGWGEGLELPPFFRHFQHQKHQKTSKKHKKTPKNTQKYQKNNKKSIKKIKKKFLGYFSTHGRLLVYIYYDPLLKFIRMGVFNSLLTDPQSRREHYIVLKLIYKITHISFYIIHYYLFFLVYADYYLR